MNAKTKNKVNKYVRSRFPDLKGINPSIVKQTSSKKNYLFTYKGSAKLANGKKMPIIVRVVCTEDGRITKLSSSRWGKSYTDMRSARFNERFELTLWVSLVKVSKNLNKHSRYLRLVPQEKNSLIATPKLMLQIISTAVIGLILGIFSGVLIALIQ